MQHCNPSPSLLQSHKAHNIASPHQSPKMQKHAHLPRHLADNTRRNVKWTSEASAANRGKYSLEQLPVVSFHPHSPKLKPSPTEALVHTVVPSISLKLRMRSPHLQLLNRTTHPDIISSWTSLLIYNKLLKLSASEPSYHLFLSLSSHLQQCTKTFCLRTQPSLTESLLNDNKTSLNFVLTIPGYLLQEPLLLSLHRNSSDLLLLIPIPEQTKI